MLDTDLARTTAREQEAASMRTLEIYLLNFSWYAVWLDEYGQIQQVADIPPSIGGESERLLVSDQRLWNRSVPADEFLVIEKSASIR
jgi:hypothetical protein